MTYVQCIYHVHIIDHLAHFLDVPVMFINLNYFLINKFIWLTSFLFLYFCKKLENILFLLCFVVVIVVDVHL